MKIKRKYQQPPTGKPIDKAAIVEDLKICLTVIAKTGQGFQDIQVPEDDLRKDAVMNEILDQFKHSFRMTMTNRIGVLFNDSAKAILSLIETFKTDEEMIQGELTHPQSKMMAMYEKAIVITEYGVGLLAKAVSVIKKESPDGKLPNVEDIDMTEPDGKHLLVETPTVVRLLTSFPDEIANGGTSPSTESYVPKQRLDSSNEMIGKFIRKFMSTVYGKDIDVKPLLDSNKRLANVAEFISGGFTDGEFEEKVLFKNRELRKIITTLMNYLKASNNKLGPKYTEPFDQVMMYLYADLSSNIEYTTKALKAEGTFFSSTKLTAKQANLIKSYDHFISLIEYGTNLLNLCIEASGDDATNGNANANAMSSCPIDRAKLLADAEGIATLMYVYCSTRPTYEKLVNALSDEIITPDADEQRNAYLMNENTDLNPLLPSGWIGSFIFSIRSGSAAKKVKQMILLEEKIVLMQSRILILKRLKEEGSASERDIRDIEIFEERLLVMQKELDEFQKEIE